MLFVNELIPLRVHFEKIFTVKKRVSCDGKKNFFLFSGAARVLKFCSSMNVTWIFVIITRNIEND